MNVAVPSFSEMSHGELSERAALALVAGKMGAFDYYPETGNCVPDRTMCNLWGIPYQPVLDHEIFKRVHPEDLGDLHVAVNRAIEGGDDYEATFRIRHDNGKVVWIGARGRVVEHNPDGTAKRMLGLNWDVTDEKIREERLTHLVQEMNHRVNNAFALIDAMLMIGRETATDLDSFADLMSTQVHALADAHHLVADFFLLSPDSEDRVQISSVLNKVLRTWQMGALNDRIFVDLSCDPALPPQDIASLAMVLYELATNAAKYSVLGQQPGTLTVRVDRMEDRFYQLEWHETLAAPRSEQPANGSSSEFGAILTQHCLAKLKATEVTRDLDETGFRFSTIFPAMDTH